MERPRAGWYPDPQQPTARLRYWRGSTWSDRIDDDGVVTSRPLEPRVPTGAWTVIALTWVFGLVAAGVVIPVVAFGAGSGGSSIAFAVTLAVVLTVVVLASVTVGIVALARGPDRRPPLPGARTERQPSD